MKNEKIENISVSSEDEELEAKLREKEKEPVKLTKP